MDVFENMERVVGGQISFHCSSPSSRRGRYSSFQGSVLIWFLIFSSQITWAVSERNTKIILNGSEVWDKTALKNITGLQCSKFHEGNFSSYFFNWPEDDFEYCCVGFAHKQNLSDYRYTMYGNPLNEARYWDLGLIDKCLPYYWNCWHLYDRYLESPVFGTTCEYTDVIHLYTDRFWRLIVGKYGLLATALPLIGTLQLFVFLAITLEVVYWRYWHSKQIEKTQMPLAKLKKITKIWFKASRKNACIDWLHLCLLSIIGNGLVEAVGRQNPYDWQSKTFYRYSSVYFALSVILWSSSFLHQVTQWIAVDKKVTKQKQRKKNVSVAADQGAAEEGGLHSTQAEETRIEIDHHDSNISGTTNSGRIVDLAVVAKQIRKLLSMGPSTKKDPVAELKKLLLLGPDWKWQPIAAQTAILFCLWAYLTYPSDSELSSTLLGFLVQAASPWSGLYACRVAFVTFPFLLKKFFDVKHIRHLLHSCRASEGGQRKPFPGWIPLKTFLLNLPCGRVLCCVGCCAGRSAEEKPQEKRIDIESSCDSDDD